MPDFSSNTPTHLTRELLAALECGVFERIDNVTFQASGAVPEWLSLDTGVLQAALRFPHLEAFLNECGAVWESASPARKASEIWLEGERYLQAVALRAEGRSLLLLRSVPQSSTVRDLAAEKEKVARMGQMLAAVSAELEAKRVEAERARRAQSDFLATMSHEIRTPLNAIIGMADILASTGLSPDQTKCVEVFQRNGAGLVNLINNILDLAIVEAGKTALERTEFDLQEMLLRAQEVVQARAAAKALDLHHAIAPGVPRRLTGDANRLRQVIVNLLSNAIKFTDKGSLSIEVEDEPGAPSGTLRFAVRDTGIGIPADRLGTIFDGFVHPQHSTTRRHSGAGLGLTISRQLVELMGGRIWVESTVGVGSTFYFTVALEPAKSPITVPKIAPTVPVNEMERRLAGLKILLAEDADDNRFLILSYLKKSKCEIVTAENGEEALERFAGAPFDVVLMDVEMPLMDGLDATREIRKLERTRNQSATPVLALTAHAASDMATKSAEAGFTAVLTKPIRKADLLQALVEYSGRSDYKQTTSAPASDDT